MKRFTISVLAIAVFFIGLGSLIERTGAKFKSDPQALEMICEKRESPSAAMPTSTMSEV